MDNVPAAAVAAVSTLGTVLVFFMLSAQLPAVYTVMTKTKSIAGLSVVPTIGQMANFVTWTVYAIVKEDGPLLRVNAIGIAFAAGYLAVFLTYANSRRAKLFLTLVGLLAAAAGVEAAIWFGTESQPLRSDLRLTLMGAFAVACNVVMYAAPIAQLRVAFASMNPSALPILLCIANTATSGCWLMYGLFTGPNWLVAGPNVAGCALNVIQLACGAYISLAASRDPSIVKPLPGAAAASGKGDDGEDAEYAENDEEGGGARLIKGSGGGASAGASSRYSLLPTN